MANRSKLWGVSPLSYFETCTKLSQRLTEDTYIQALNIARPGALADFITAQIEPPQLTRQELLETFDPHDRLRKAWCCSSAELGVLELEQKIHTDRCSVRWSAASGNITCASR